MFRSLYFHVEYHRFEEREREENRIQEKGSKKIARNTKTEDKNNKAELEAEHDKLEAWVKSLEVKHRVPDEESMVDISELD